jgi:integrase
VPLTNGGLTQVRPLRICKWGLIPSATEYAGYSGPSKALFARLEVPKTLRSFRTEKQRLGWWNDRLGHRAVRSVIANDIEQARIELLDECAPAMVNRYLAALKATFSLAIRNRKADSIPVKAVKFLRENNLCVQWPNEMEASRLMAVLPKKFKPMVIVALKTGLRKSEQLHLQWRESDFRQDFILVGNSKPGDS